MTSYLQPILLWTGATLICRALAPITMPTDASQLVKQRLLTFVQSLSTVLAFAYCLSSMIQQAHKYFMETNDPTDTRNGLTVEKDNENLEENEEENRVGEFDSEDEELDEDEELEDLTLP